MDSIQKENAKKQKSILNPSSEGTANVSHNMPWIFDECQIQFKFN